ncbi:MAG: DNA N-6-adenine-methyltransferase [Pseudomonadota bacterium]
MDFEPGTRVYCGTPESPGTVTSQERNKVWVQTDDGRHVGVRPDKLHYLPASEATVDLTPIGVKSESIEADLEWTRLTPVEEKRLDELEGEIEEGAIAIFRAGFALAEVRDSKLYRASHPTFEDYCRDRWGLSKTHANRRIDAAKVAQNLTPIGVKLQRESHARPLAKLPPEQQRQAMQLALSFDIPITAKALEQASQQVTTGEAPKGERLDNPDAHNEYPTPDHVLERVYRCLGTVDLDPCSDGCWPPNVQATHHYTEQHNGLAHEWFGKVYCNPPYVKGCLPEWTPKLLKEFNEGRVTEAIYLVPAYTAEGWFQLLREFPRGFFRSRLKFKGQSSQARFPSAIFYLGHNTNAFGAAFHDLCDFYLLSNLED